MHACLSNHVDLYEIQICIEIVRTITNNNSNADKKRTLEVFSLLTAPSSASKWHSSSDTNTLLRSTPFLPKPR